MDVFDSYFSCHLTEFVLLLSTFLRLFTGFSGEIGRFILLLTSYFRVYLVDFSVILRIQVSAVAQFVFQLSSGFCYFISRVSMFD